MPVMPWNQRSYDIGVADAARFLAESHLRQATRNPAIVSHRRFEAMTWRIVGSAIHRKRHENQPFALARFNTWANDETGRCIDLLDGQVPKDTPEGL